MYLAASKIKKNDGLIKRALKTKLFFNIMSLAQRNSFSKVDGDYWSEKGRTNKQRPWKS